jgi:hypothetical protein
MLSNEKHFIQCNAVHDRDCLHVLKNAELLTFVKAAGSFVIIGPDYPLTFKAAMMQYARLMGARGIEPYTLLCHICSQLGLPHLLSARLATSALS